MGTSMRPVKEEINANHA